MEYVVYVSEEENKALLTEIVSPQEWLNNAVHNRARQAIDHIVQEYSDKQPNKLSTSERAQIVMDANVETAAEREARLEIGG